MDAARRAGLPRSVNTQINRLSMRDLPSVFDTVVETGAHGWQLQLTVPEAAAEGLPTGAQLQPAHAADVVDVRVGLRFPRADRRGRPLRLRSGGARRTVVWFAHGLDVVVVLVLLVGPETQVGHGPAPHGRHTRPFVERRTLVFHA